MNQEFSLLNNYWHLIGHKKELVNNGDYVKFKALSGEIVVFNDGGKILAFDNKCAHRGARIYINEFGSQPNSCPYHGWTFRNGSIEVPSQEGFKNCDIQTARLNFYKVEFCGDFIFFSIAPLMALEEQIGEAYQILEEISLNISNRHDFNSFDFKSTWPIAIENALESYHIDLVHKTTLATLKIGAGIVELGQYQSIWMAPINDSHKEKKLRSIKKLFMIDYQFEGYMSIYLYPFAMISSTFGYSYSLQNFFPSTPDCIEDSTNFTSRLYVVHPAGSKEAVILDGFFKSSAEINRQVFEEDSNICSRLPRDSWSVEPLRYCAESEIRINHFRSLCRDVVMGGVVTN